MLIGNAHVKTTFCPRNAITARKRQSVENDLNVRPGPKLRKTTYVDEALTCQGRRLIRQSRLDLRDEGRDVGRSGPLNGDSRLNGPPFPSNRRRQALLDFINGEQRPLLVAAAVHVPDKDWIAGTYNASVIVENQGGLLHV